MKDRPAILINEAVNVQAGSNFSLTNWIFFYIAIFFFVANMFVALSIYPAYSLAIGSSSFQAGLQNTVLSITAVLLRFFLGPVLDQQGPKPLMLLGTFTFALSPLFLIAVPTYSMLILMRIFQALGLAVVLPGISTLAAGMAPPDKIGSYLGSTRIFFNLGLLIGPSAALYIIENSGYNSMFMVSSVSLIISTAAIALVKTPMLAATHKKRANLLMQFKKALAIKAIYPIIGGIAVYAFTYSAIISFSAVHIEISVPSADTPLFFIILGVAGIVACLGVGVLSDRLGRRKVAWPLLAILGAGAVSFYFIPDRPFLVYASAAILGLGIQGTSLALAAWLIDISKPSLRATVLSLQENTIDILFAFGAFIFGAAAGGAGLGTAFLAAGIVTIFLVLPLNRGSLKNASAPDSENNHPFG